MPVKATPERRLRLVSALAPGVPAVLAIKTAGEAEDFYFVAELPCDSAVHRLFEVVGYRTQDAGREDGVRRYSVLVPSPTTSEAGACDCPGGTYHQDKPCRHLAALTTLWKGGRL